MDERNMLGNKKLALDGAREFEVRSTHLDSLYKDTRNEYNMARKEGNNEG